MHNNLLLGCILKNFWGVSNEFMKMCARTICLYYAYISLSAFSGGFLGLLQQFYFHKHNKTAAWFQYSTKFYSNEYAYIPKHFLPLYTDLDMPVFRAIVSIIKLLNIFLARFFLIALKIEYLSEIMNKFRIGTWIINTISSKMQYFESAPFS